MGAKITIDSASMMNKGLEVIEAHWLFQLPYEKISMYCFIRKVLSTLWLNSMIAVLLPSLGSPDMRVPIQFALSYPDRLAAYKCSSI